MSQLPQLEEMRNRIQQRINEFRGKIGFAQQRKGLPQFGQIGKGQFGQGKLLNQVLGRQIGKGQLVNRARAKVVEVQRRLQTRTRGLGRRQPFRSNITDLCPAGPRSGKGFSVAEEPAKPADHREIIVEL